MQTLDIWALNSNYSWCVRASPVKWENFRGYRDNAVIRSGLSIWGWKRQIRPCTVKKHVCFAACSVSISVCQSTPVNHICFSVSKKVVERWWRIYYNRWPGPRKRWELLHHSSLIKKYKDSLSWPRLIQVGSVLSTTNGCNLSPSKTHNKFNIATDEESLLLLSDS